MPTNSNGNSVWPVAIDPYQGAATITPGQSVVGGRGVAIACTVAGNVRLLMADGSGLTIPVNVGFSIIDNIAVKDVSAGQTTATAVVSVLR